MVARHPWNPTTTGTQDLETFPGLCKQVRYRKSDCRKCADICPENAISLAPGPTVSDSCSVCGLCLRVCPTEVFREDRCSEQRLLEQASSRLAADGNKRLSIHCHRAENPNKDSMFIPCLGRISENLILGAALAGFEEAVFTRASCSGCRFKGGDEVLAKSIQASRPLLEGLGLGNLSIRVEEKEKKTVLERRHIFSRIFEKAEAITAGVSARPERRDSRECSPARSLLRRLLGHRDWKEAVVVRYEKEFPWGQVWIDAGKCSACGICSKVCPVAAIRQEPDQEGQLLFFESALCHNCRLCQEACPENAIDFEEHLAVTALTDSSARMVARIPMSSCVLCGHSIPARGGLSCPTCRKRQPPLGWLTVRKETYDQG